MKTTELVRKMIRKLSVNDWGALPLDGRMEIVDCINTGLQKLYTILPSQYRITTISSTLNAPTTLGIDVVKGQNEVLLSAGPSQVPFTYAQRGSTVVIGDDPLFNEIVSTTSILDAYQGTSGSVTSTIYGDAVPIWDRDIIRMVSDPILNDGTRLARLNDVSQLIIGQQGYLGSINENRMSQRQIGRPQYYTIDLVGHSQSDGSTEPVVILRVDPMPSQLYTIRFEAELSPMRITFSHLQTPVDLPIPDYMVESMLLPICIGELTMSSYWADEKTIPMAEKQAAIAIDIARRQTSNFALPRNFVRTKPGY
jgi:hypothetical protein